MLAIKNIRNVIFLIANIDFTLFPEEEYQLVTIPFIVPFGVTNVQLQFTGANVLLGAWTLIDDVAITLIAICYSGDSIVHTRNIETGEIADIEARYVYFGVYEVFSVNKKEFISVR